MTDKERFKSIQRDIFLGNFDLWADQKRGLSVEEKGAIEWLFLMAGKGITASLLEDHQSE